MATQARFNLISTRLVQRHLNDRHQTSSQLAIRGFSFFASGHLNLQNMAINGFQPELIYSTLTDVPILDVVHLASSERGLIAVAYNISTEEFLMQLVAERQPASLSDKDGLATARAQLREYLCGARTQFSLPLDLNHITDFQRLVLKTVECVPYGVTRSYGEIAAQIGRPRAARAVGQANSRNPLPMVIPCHRVIAADGSLGGYSGAGGLRTKLRLLRLEGVRF